MYQAFFGAHSDDEEKVIMAFFDNKEKGRALRSFSVSSVEVIENLQQRMARHGLGDALIW
jgi:hypothetical protein